MDTKRVKRFQPHASNRGKQLFAIILVLLLFIACSPNESVPVFKTYDGQLDEFNNAPESKLNWVKNGVFSARFKEDGGTKHPISVLVEGMAMAPTNEQLYLLGTMTQGEVQFVADGNGADSIFCEGDQGCIFLVRYDAHGENLPSQKWDQVVALSEATEGGANIFEDTTGVAITPEGDALFLGIFENELNLDSRDADDANTVHSQLDSVYGATFSPEQRCNSAWKLVEQIHSDIAPFDVFKEDESPKLAVTGVASYTLQINEKDTPEKGPAVFGKDENRTATLGDFPIGFVAKYSKDGTAEWVKRFDWTEGYKGIHPMDIVGHDTNGELTVLGYFDNDQPDLNLKVVGEDDLFLIHFDKEGDVRWAHSIGGDFDDRGISLAATAEGDVLVTGFLGGSGTLFTNGEFAQEINCQKVNSGCQFVGKFSGNDDHGKLLWYQARNPINTGEEILWETRDISYGIDITVATDGTVIVLGLDTDHDFVSEDSFKTVVSPWDIEDNGALSQTASKKTDNIYMAQYATDGKLSGTRRVISLAANKHFFDQPFNGFVQVLSDESVLVSGSIVDEAKLEVGTKEETTIGKLDHGSFFVASYNTDWKRPVPFVIDEGDCFEDCSKRAILTPECRSAVNNCLADEECSTFFNCRQTECCEDGYGCMQGNEWELCFSECVTKNGTSSGAFEKYMKIDECVACNTCPNTCAQKESRNFPLCAEKEKVKSPETPCVWEDVDHGTNSDVGEEGTVACVSWAGWGGGGCVGARFDCEIDTGCDELKDLMVKAEEDAKTLADFDPWNTDCYTQADTNAQALYKAYAQCIYCVECAVPCENRKTAYCGDVNL